MNLSARLSALSMVALAYGDSYLGATYLEKKVNTGPKPEPCLTCGNIKVHNNCWCSVACKELYYNNKQAIAFAEDLGPMLPIESNDALPA